MTPERFARLREAILTAGRLPPEARSAYVAEASAGDPDFRADLESVLAQDSRSVGVLRSLHLTSLAAAPPPTVRSRPMPTRVGAYRILGVLGEGGMGIVYRAEQEHPIRREVALKLVRGGLDSDRVAFRFETERQALAAMDHPNIARVLDAGQHDDGSPYFVMELVRGVPITEYCRDHDLRLRRRLELFRTLCLAVQHAHQKGIIHRDLKPSNLLVTAHHDEPGVKVIDFGIAKAMETDSATPGLTREGQILGTLEYMSPEQAGGLHAAVDTRTDVYSLGVVLYELVSEKLPHPVKGLAIPDALRAIIDDPVPPLRATPTGERFDADLDTIAGKAMHKVPEERYASAAALADDIDRFLRSEPILARRASRAYQLRKFVARHKAPVAAALVTGVLLITFSVIVTIMMRAQTRERSRAEHEAARARQSNQFMRDLLLSSSPYDEGRGRETTVREMLEEARSRIDAGAVQDPAVEVVIRQSLADTYASFDSHFDSIAELRAALHAAERGGPDLWEERASVLQSLGARLYYQGSEAAQTEAETVWREALEILKRAPGTHPETPALLSNLAMIRTREGDHERAEALLREAVVLQRRLNVEDPSFEVPTLTQSNLAQVVAAQGRLHESSLLIREAMGTDRRRGHTLALSFNASRLATLCLMEGDYAEAESLLFPAIAVKDSAFGKDMHWWCVRDRLMLASAFRCRGKYAAAESLLRECETMCSRLSNPQEEVVARIQHELGLVLTALQRFDEAERAHRAALEIARRMVRAQGVLVACALRGTADLRRVERRTAEAEMLLRQALDHHARAPVSDVAEYAQALLDLGLLLLEQPAGVGRSAEAASVLQRCLELQSHGDWPRDWRALVAKHLLARSAGHRDHETGGIPGVITDDILTVEPSPLPLELRNRLLALDGGRPMRPSHGA